VALPLKTVCARAFPSAFLLSGFSRKKTRIIFGIVVNQLVRNVKGLERETTLALIQSYCGQSGTVPAPNVGDDGFSINRKSSTLVLEEIGK